MTYDEMREIVLDLPFDTMTEVYNNGESKQFFRLESMIE